MDLQFVYNLPFWGMDPRGMDPKWHESERDCLQHKVITKNRQKCDLPGNGLFYKLLAGSSPIGSHPHAHAYARVYAHMHTCAP